MEKETQNTKVSKYTNLEPNAAAALAYLLTPVTGVFFFLVEKEDKFVRFHAFQSILFGLAAFGAYFIALSLIVLIIGVLLVPVVTISSFIFYGLLMWKAYNGEDYELPVLGKMAKDQIK